MKKIGFVTPWYGENISGGAEAELRGLVHHLRESGTELEVLSTCVKSFPSDWNENYHEPGLTEENGIPVRRFPVRKRDTEAFDAVNLKLMTGEPVSAEEEETYCQEMINSPALYDYLKEHAEEYQVFVFIPYMFGTTYYGCQACPEKSVLIPCLHDEPYAYMDCFREVFSKVRGMIFHADPERRLAERLYGVKGDKFVTLGEGIDTDWTADPKRFRDKFGIRDPFILYAGRKEAGKRVDVLVRWFAEYQKRHDDALKLVLIGGGEIALPDRENILDLGFVDKQDKYDAYAAADVFCNPSEMESFSLVVMESWLAGRPVLVNGKCAVTTDFVRQANAGLYYNNYAEFEKCLEYFRDHRKEADRMGRNGRAFAMSRFTWDVIVRIYTAFFEQIGK